MHSANAYFKHGGVIDGFERSIHGSWGRLGLQMICLQGLYYKRPSSIFCISYF